MAHASGSSASSARRPHAVARDDDIRDAIRSQLIERPGSSLRELAAAADSGMSAIYSRYGDRAELLRWFADEGNALFAESLEGAHDALSAGEDGRAVLDRFVRTPRAADSMALALSVMGTFERTREELDETARLAQLGEGLVGRLRDAGALRVGVGWNDLGKIFEMIGNVRGDGRDRTAQLQSRVIDIVLAGLRPELPALEGEPPEPRDFYVAARRARARR